MHMILSLIPILSLLICLMVFKLSASRAGAVSLLFAFVIAFLFFGIDVSGMSIAIAKGITLALFVLLIIWAALFLYHLVEDFKAIEVINKNIVIFVRDRFVQFLLISWLFSAMLQGIAGFGVPVIITTPILISLGFNPVTSVAAVLIGHSWSVIFGSMGTPFYAIFLISGIPQQYLGAVMWIFAIPTMILTGLAVCYLYGGVKYLLKGIKYILPVSALTVAAMYITLHFRMFSLVGLTSALTGLITMYIMYRLSVKDEGKKQLYSSSLTLWQAVLPHASIIVLTLLIQVLNVGHIATIAFNFPGFVTELGHIVNPEPAYSTIRLFGHPAPILLSAAGIGALTYKKIGIWDTGIFKGVVKKTVNRCIPTSISLLCLIIMALIMMDSGMTNELATGTAEISGRFYPLLAPLFGVLGSFITGSNTNSNVLFGQFQYSIARTLNVSTAVMCGAQTVGGSVGISISPNAVLMGTSAAKLVDQESLIYKKTFGIAILIALVLGVLNFILLEVIGFIVI